MKNRFTIGEMSKLNNVPVKTLRYYDDIGLFKPIEVDEHSGYRYYSTEQFEQLNVINYLKFLGFPLKGIQKHLATRDVEYFLGLLKKQKQITEDTIKRLEMVSNQFANRIKEIEQSLKIDVLEVPVLRWIPERTIISFHEQICSDAEWEIALRKLENLVGGNPSLFIGKVGLTVAKNNLLRNKLDEYSSVFIVWEEPAAANELIKHFREGDYACLYYRGGNHSSSKQYYDKILQFIDAHGCELDGDAIERTIIDQYITADHARHLTEIQVPVKLKP